MNKSKILSLILSLVLSLSCITPVIAADDTTPVIPEYETNLLNALGININNSVPTVTRGEFAKQLAIAAGNMMVLSDVSDSPFTDVSKGTSSGKYIIGAYKLGFMNGIGDGLFAPNNAISSVDAAVALVRLAGYDIAAKAEGGYPTGYLKVANRVGILDNISVSNNSLTPAELSTLIYNVLHVDVYVLQSVGEDTEYKAIKGDDVLKLYHDTYKMEGTVTGNRFTSLATYETKCTADEIEIDKELFKSSSDKLADYLGLKVTAYYKKASSSKMGTVISMYADEYDNKIVELTDEDIGGISGNTLKYYDGDKEKTANIIRGFNLIYNGKYDSEGTMETLTGEGLEVTLIDSDNLSGYETVIVNQAETMIVTNIDRTEYIIFGKNNMSVNYDSSDTSSYFSIIDKDGNDVYIDRIKNGNVLTVYASRDNKCIRVILSTEFVTGKITSLNSEDKELTLNVNGEEKIYKAVPAYVSDMKLGLEGDFYLDNLGRLVYTKAEIGADFEYGYLINIDIKTSLDRPEVMILTPEDFKIFKVAKDFMLDGIKTTLTKDDSALVMGGEAVPQVVRFKLNSAGELKYLDTVAVGSGNEVNDKLAFSKTISGNYHSVFPTISNQLSIDSNTLFVLAPLSDNYKYDQDYYRIGRDMLNDWGEYTVDAYDVDDTLTAKVVVYKNDNVSAGNLDHYATTSIVSEKNIKVVDKEGQVRDAIRVFGKTGDEKLLYFNFDKYKDLDGNKDDITGDMDMQYGDIIRYSADSNGNIINWKYEYEVAKGITTTGTDDGYWTINEGYPYAKEDSRFSFLSSIGNDNLDETPEYLYVYPSTMLTYIEVDMLTGEIAKSSYDYLGSYKHSKDNSDKCYLKVYRGGGRYTDIFVIYKNFEQWKANQ